MHLQYHGVGGQRPEGVTQPGASTGADSIFLAEFADLSFVLNDSEVPPARVCTARLRERCSRSSSAFTRPSPVLAGSYCALLHIRIVVEKRGRSVSVAVIVVFA